jgi:heparan-alpha-glucosaminide N-acetyltransferase
MRTKQDRLRVLQTVLSSEEGEGQLQELQIASSAVAAAEPPPKPAQPGPAAVPPPKPAQPASAPASTPTSRPTASDPIVPPISVSRPEISRPSSPAPSVPRLRAGRPSLPTGPRRAVAQPGTAPGRLASLDAFRGFIMMMLAAGGFGILRFSRLPEDAPVWAVADRAVWQQLGFHFDHPAWISVFDGWRVAFWDLIQPAFMFMVGVAMPFSYARRQSQGHGWFAMSVHAIVRAVVLVLLGVFLSSLGKPSTNWVFPNVLCQIGLGYFFAWLLLNRPLAVQLAALVLILGGYWAWFRFTPPAADYDYKAVSADVEKGEVFEGAWAGWSKNANAAYRVDDWLLRQLRSPEMPEVAEPPGAVANAAPNGINLKKAFFSNPEPYVPNAGGYTTLNFVPSIATTLLGILCGQWLLSSTLAGWEKLLRLLLLGGICLGLGLLAHATICPAVKRIWTPSWALVSGGYVIGMLAVFYILFDLLPLRLLAFPLVVVGSNSILIYLLGQTLNGWVREQLIRVHLSGFIEQAFGSRALDDQWYGLLVMPTTVFALYWLLLLWLYRQKLFIRI